MTEEHGGNVDGLLSRDATEPAKFNEAVWGRVFNRRRDAARVPRAVIRASSATQVKAAVEWANREGCRVSVRSGGHSWAAWSVRQDALLIDLGDFREISYDDKTQIVSCSPSTTGRELNGFLSTKGRIFAGGHCPDVGLGGFLLQGGMGWNCKGWGWACETMVGINVVTAEANETYCSSDENADLFWAARGAGPGFPAIVTRFHLLTRPLLEMYKSVYVYPKSEYRTVLQWVVETSPTADPDTEIVCLSKRSVDSDEIQIIAAFTTFKASKQGAEEALRPVHNGHPQNALVEIFCEPTSLQQEYVVQEQEQPVGFRYCSENAYIANDADVSSVLESVFTTLPTQKSFALYLAMNPTSRKPLPDMALSMHSDHYFALYTIWQDESEDDRCMSWVRNIMRGAEKHSVGSYLGDADFQRRTTMFWSKDNGGRLAAVRRKWDPKGRICGYLDTDDKSGVSGLKNEFEWVDAE